MAYIQHVFSKQRFEFIVVYLNEVGAVPPFCQFNRDYSLKIEILGFIKICREGGTASHLLILLKDLHKRVFSNTITQGKLICSFDDMVHLQIGRILWSQTRISFFSSEGVDVIHKRIEQTVVGSRNPSIHVVDHLVIVADLVLQKYTRKEVGIFLSIDLIEGLRGSCDIGIFHPQARLIG